MGWPVLRYLAPMWAYLQRRTPPLDSYWLSLHYFNLYRLSVAGVFLASSALFTAARVYGAEDPVWFLRICGIYVVFGGLMAVTISSRWPAFNLQLTLQTLGDIGFIVLLMHVSGGVRSGLGLLLVVALAASSLISKGRQVMFFAATAAVAVLLEQSFRIFVQHGEGDFLQAGLLGMGFFAIAGLGYFLAKQVLVSERLARQKSIDLANLALVNELVIQEMEDGVLVVDETGRVRGHNASCEKLLGGPPPRYWKDLRLNDYAPALAERLAQWRKDRNAVFAPLRVAVTGKQIATRFSPIARGGDIGAVIFLGDLSRQQAQAQQIKLAALGRLTASIAHEIRNPLSAISHATQLLQEDERDQTGARLLQIIRDNTLRLNRMVQDVLQLNRRDRAQCETIYPEAFLGSFIEQFCLAEKISADSISLEIDDVQSLCFDRAHLHQVLWNLCANAWRHGRKRDASIRLCVSQAHLANVVQIDVIDDGEGVAKQLQSQLFEPFFTTFSSGTGLGLYIAREICEANGATLDYVEVSPGGQFRICCKGGPC